MKSSVVDEFIKYAKEQFGCDIYLQHSAESDSFASIFGASFLNQNGPMEKVEEFNLDFQNENVAISITFEGDLTNDRGVAIPENIELAA